MTPSYRSHKKDFLAGRVFEEKKKNYYWNCHWNRIFSLKNRICLRRRFQGTEWFYPIFVQHFVPSIKLQQLTQTALSHKKFRSLKHSCRIVRIICNNFRRKNFQNLIEWRFSISTRCIRKSGQSDLSCLQVSTQPR